MTAPRRPNLQDITNEELRDLVRRTRHGATHRKCPLCRSRFKVSKHNQIFDTNNCRRQHWRLEKELGVIETKARLDQLEEIGQLPFKDVSS